MIPDHNLGKYFVTAFVMHYMAQALGMTRSNIIDIDKIFELLCQHTLENVSYFPAASL